MASDGSSNPGRLCLVETVNHWQYMLTIMEKDRCEPGDFDKLEKAVQQTFDWLNKNQHAKKDECYRLERKLMRLGEHVLDRSNVGSRGPEPTPEPTPEPSSSASAAAPPLRRRRA